MLVSLLFPFPALGFKSDMKFQYLSDLHLEVVPSYEKYEIYPRAPYLILAGDIGQLCDPGLRLFLRTQCQQFERVFYVLGNHELYTLSHEQALEICSDLESDVLMDKRLSILYRKRVEVDNVVILGCTLYSNLDLSRHNDSLTLLSDFTRINNWSVESHLKAHRADSDWLKDQLLLESQRQGSPRKVLVITHFAPTFVNSSDPAKRNEKLDSYFATELLSASAWQGIDLVNAWVYGHTHWRCDFELGPVRVLSNARGVVLAHNDDNPLDNNSGNQMAFSKDRVIDI
uniref:ARAD1D44022p n=1 Tax=Blastobotrys adeninivorans TaxID=409370 RepID=A0A060TD13_BLAAD